MLRRLLKSGWRWRSTNAPNPHHHFHQNTLSRWMMISQPIRHFGVANVWIDKHTAAHRRANKIPVPRRRRREKVDERGRPIVPPHELKGGKGIERKWRDGTPRPPGREGRLRRLDSGKLIGRHRKHLVNKYGMPKRVPRKIRLERLEKSKLDWILKRKMETDPDFKAEVEKARSARTGCSESGAERRLREKEMEWRTMNRYEKRRAEEEKSAAEYFSSPLTSERKMVKTMFGEIDVTAAKRYRELKVERRKMVAASEQPLQIEGGLEGVVKTKVAGDGSGVLMKANVKLDVKSQFSKEDEFMQRLRRRALKLQEEEKVRGKLLSSAVAGKESLLALDEPCKVRKSGEKVTEDVVDDEIGRETICSTAAVEDEAEPNQDHVQTEEFKTWEEVPEQMKEDDKFDREVEVTLVDKIEEEGFSAEEDADNWQWCLDSTKPIDETYEGWKIAQVLGTSQLLGLPRLAKTKKPKPRPTKAAVEEEDIIFTPAPRTEEAPETLPTLYSPEERTKSLQRQIIEKTLEEYHMILKSELHAPLKKPWTRRVLKADKDDITSKKYMTPEERKASGKVDLEKLGSRALFRQIQPSRELRLYIDSQLLGKRRLDEWRKAGYNVKLYSPLDNVPFHKGEVKHRIHQSVFRNPQVFVAAARELASIPPSDMPEVAFVGRTNVGKSKLINALTRRYGTARTSPVPGKTESINFYALGEKLCMVDTPGFSFMYGKQEQIEHLRQLTKDYITVRDGLRVCLLIDAQWGLRQKDEEFIEFLESVHRKYQIVLSKTDKVLPLDLARRATKVQEQIKDCKYHAGPLLMVSALSGAGIGKLRMSIANLL